MIVEAGPDAVEKVPGTTYRLTTGPPRPRAGESLTARALTQRVVLAMIKRPAAAGLPALDPLLHTFRATGITAYLSNGRISLESEFLVMPKGKGFVEFPVFEEGYEALKRGTGSFRNVTPDTVGRVVAETPIALIVLRCMLGFTPPEWAYYASRQDWREITQGAVRAIDRGIRVDPKAALPKKGGITHGRIRALITAACRALEVGVPEEARDTLHRLEKADTKAGLVSVGVPYSILLYERLLGRPLAGHRDSISELIGNIAVRGSRVQ